MGLPLSCSMVNRFRGKMAKNEKSRNKAIEGVNRKSRFNFICRNFIGRENDEK